MINPNDNKLLLPGQCKIDSIIIKSYNGFQIDIRNHMAELIINESIDYTCISGYVMIADNLNLIRHVPLIGNERIEIKFSTPSRERPINKTFFCYKIDDRHESSTTKGAVVYKLHFVSEEFINSKNKKISLSFEDMQYSEMVKIICSQYLNPSKKILVQPTLGKKNLVIPYLSPIEAINMICKLSLSNDTRDKSYIFYEDFENYMFCNINYIGNMTGVSSTYSWGKPGLSVPGEPYVLKNLAADFKRIESYKIITANNTINNVQNGLFASVMLLHDVTFKTAEIVKFSYNNDFYNLNTINKYGILPKKGDKFSDNNLAHAVFYPRQSFSHSNVELNEDYDKVVLSRNAHLAQMENSRLTILIAGDSDRRVGEMIKVNIFAPEPLINHDDELNDKYLSGNYIITQITHIVQKTEYKMRLYLERDSMSYAYPEEKQVEVEQ